MDADQLFVVMEFCDSGSLDRIVNELTLDQKLSILDSVAKGVAHLHRCGVVHRDLAARNVLLNETRDGFSAKVSDFGMSRMVDKFETQGQTNAAVGPVKYMAPEGLAKKLYSFASDVWTFAVLCSEVLSGVAPHASLDLFTAGLRIRDEGLTPDLPKDTPDWLQALCKRCWSMKPAARPSMDDVVKEFKANVAQHAATVRAPKSAASTLGSKSTATPSSSAQPMTYAKSSNLDQSDEPSSDNKKNKKSKDVEAPEAESESDDSSSEESTGEESEEEESDSESESESS
jgi:serine/threonine protein kinase